MGTIPPPPPPGYPPPGFPPPGYPPPPSASPSHSFIHRYRLPLITTGVVVAALGVAAAVVSIVRTVAPASALLPSVPSGWTRLATITDSQSSGTTVNLHHVQLRICWAVKSSSIVSLSYEIGSPLDGPTQVYGTGTGSTGCVYDPGNDTGSESFEVIESGIGTYAVSLDEELSPAQERALAEQQQEQEQQAALQQQEGTIDRAASTAASDLQDAQSETASVQGDLSQISSDLGQEKSELTTTQQQAQMAEGEGGGPTACGDADTAQGDADTVQGDADTVQGDLDSLGADQGDLTKALNALKSDEASYLQVAAGLSSYKSPDAPSSSAVQAAESAAQSALASAQTTASQATTEAASLVSQANAAAQAATQAECG